MLPIFQTTKPLRKTLKDELKTFILDHMSCKAQYRDELAQKNVEELLILYLNWRSRQIDPQPRKVHRSLALEASTFLRESRYASALAQIERGLATGRNLNGYLSKRILEGYYPSQMPGRKPLKLATQRPDLDMLLNDWRLHHLHLSTLLTPGGFRARTAPVLIAAVRPADVYLVDIIKHGGWTSDHLIRIIVEEWPDAGLVQRQNGVTADVFTEDRRKLFRNNGINASVNVNGQAYIAGFYSSAGWALDIQREADRMMIELDSFCENMEADQRFDSKLFASHGVFLPPGADFHFAVFPEGGYGVVDSQTGYRINLDSQSDATTRGN